MDILSYIQRINQLYGSESAPIPAPRYNTRQYLQSERIGFKHGGSWADWMSNHSDQMTFEEYLQIDMDKPVHPINKSAGGRVYNTRKYFKPGGLVEPGVTHYGKDDELGDFIYEKTKEGNKYYELEVREMKEGKRQSLYRKSLKATPENLKILQDIIEKNIYDNSMHAIDISRNQVLNQYNIFNLMSELATNNSLKHQNIILNTNMFFKDSLIKKIIRFILSKFAH